jgi:outer membrane immunogenic protein
MNARDKETQVMATLGGSVIASAVIAGSVLAAMPALADGGGRAPPEQFPSIWRGAYFGVHVGHGESGPADGVVAGGQVGYNWQSGHIVYGLEADVSFADISFKESFMGSTVKGSIDWMATARGRVGYLLTPGILAYGTLGFGIVSGSGSAKLPGVKFSDSGSDSDIVLGLGVEAKISETMSARVEYLKFSDNDIDVVRAGLNFRFGN